MITKGVLVNRRFTVKQLLGEGGFGHVYLAFDHEIKCPCALKMLRPELSQNRQIQDSFHNEARIWLNLERHPNIVSAHAVDLFNGSLFIALEYIPPDAHGINTLGQAISKRHINLKLALKWAIEIVSGMRHAYKHGLIAHRDLKPANIMVNANDQVMITDFGLANFNMAQSRSQIDHSISGTPLYMAPEQFVDGTFCSQQSDIYSLGIILYQLIHHGTFPFDLPEPDPQAYFAVLRFVHNSYHLAKFDSPLFGVIERCLQKNPADRYQNCGDLFLDIEHIFYKELGQKYVPPTELEVAAFELNNRAVSFFLIGEIEHAFNLIDNALNLDPRFPQALNNKASFLAGSGRLADAISIWESLAQTSPKLGRSLYNLGNALMQQGNIDDAIDRFQACLSVEPDYVPAIANMAICYQGLGDVESAIKMYDEAILLAPNDAQLHYNKGVLFFDNNYFREALRCLTSATLLNLVHVSAFNYIGLCYLNMRQPANAVACFDKALLINPNYEHAVRNRALAIDCLTSDRPERDRLDPRILDE